MSDGAMTTIGVSFIQTATAWHEAQANRARFANFFPSIPERTGLLLLPEMFSTGFTMQPERIAETMDGPTARWLRDSAVALGKVIGGSVVIADSGRYFNRFLWASPDGSLAHYDKRHCFRMAGEHEHYASGRHRPVWAAGALKVRPSICYDLRFPVWLRRVNDYDLLACVANWPASRLDAWRTLLKARAIENLSFVIGVNILGRDGNGVEYEGGSMAFAPDGTCLLDAGDREGLFTVDLDLSVLTGYRRNFPAWQDADRFNVLDVE